MSNIFINLVKIIIFSLINKLPSKNLNLILNFKFKSNSEFEIQILNFKSILENKIVLK